MWVRIPLQTLVFPTSGGTIENAHSRYFFHRRSIKQVFWKVAQNTKKSLVVESIFLYCCRLRLLKLLKRNFIHSVLQKIRHNFQSTFFTVSEERKNILMRFCKFCKVYYKTPSFDAMLGFVRNHFRISNKSLFRFYKCGNNVFDIKIDFMCFWYD